VPRIAFTSDIHVDHHAEVIARVAARTRELEADALIVAGDVTPDLGRLAETLRALRDAAPRVAFLAGNHDLWSREGGPDSRARYLDVIPGVCARAGVACLHHEAVVLDGASIAGQTGWYDYSLRDPSHESEIALDAYRRGRFGRLVWTDKRFIRWPGLELADGTADDEALADWMSARLARALLDAPRDRPLVAVTHMLPFGELAPRRPLPWGFVRGFLGAATLGASIAAAVEQGAPVAYVVSGHTHFARRAEVRVNGRTLTAETSPIGYPREYGRFGLDLATHVDARVRLIEIT
jgi:predicted MPP superfamily phosphohydrolase